MNTFTVAKFKFHVLNAQRHLNQISYFSKNLDIIPSWDGGKSYTLEVYILPEKSLSRPSRPENSKILVNSISDLREFLFVKEVFENLKRDYILNRHPDVTFE